MSRRINFINPFGTIAYDGIIRETLSHYCLPDTDLDITHLSACPADMDYFYPKHFVETELLEAIMASQESGYDAVISGCCYDPAVLTARELVDIPVIGPMHASIQLLGNFGRNTLIIADHVKASALMKDNVKLYGASELVLGVDAIDWYVRDMINDPLAVARDVIDLTSSAVERTGTETVMLNCTIIAACYQKYLMSGGEPAKVPVLNPNLMALKMAESMADLYQKGGYQISRSGYYMQPTEKHYKETSVKARNAWKSVRPKLEDFFK